MDRRSFLMGASAASAIALMPGVAVARSRGRPLAATTAPADRRLYAEFDRIFAQLLQDVPELATNLGLDKGGSAALKSRLGDTSLAERGAGQARRKADARALAAIPRDSLSPVGRQRYDTVSYLLVSQIEQRDQFAYGDGSVPYVLSQLGGSYQNIPDFLDSQHGIASAADADAYLARLDAFATALDGDTQRQRADAALGVMAPRFCLETTLEQMRALRDHEPAESGLVTSLVRRATAAGLTADYGRRASAIVSSRIYPALDRQMALVRELIGRARDDAGVWALPNGDAFYSAAVGAETTTTMPPADLHQTGLAQVAQISARIDTILKARGLTQGTVGERLSALNRDPTQLFPNTDAGRADLIASLNVQVKAMRNRLPQVFATLPEAAIEVVRVPPAIQDGAPNGYYNSAALDGSRPARYYINLKDTADWPKYTLPTLTYHEAEPGHHLQISLALEAPETPMLLKLSPFGAYVEGWALYAEQLADELGVYEHDPLARAGYLQSQLFRAARLVVDTGIHNQRWDRARAIDYMVATTGFTRARVQREISRYCVWPGQACSYKVGHNEWVRLRDRARAQLGTRFDLRQFHQLLLKGALPLTQLDQEVEAWIIARQG